MSDTSHVAQVSRRNFIRGVGLLGASAALAACSAPSTEGDTTQQAGTASVATPLLAIIHTNDTHGHDVEVKSTENVEGNFSMAAVAALREEYVKRGYEVLLVDAGDATQGMPLVDNSKGEAAITFMNACGYDMMCIGNHEFDRGEERISAYVENAKFPLLSANVIDKNTGELRFEPNKVVELNDGTKVGFFGLTTPSSKTTANPKYVESYVFLADDELLTCAREQVKALRDEGCDLVVCLGHLGSDESLGENTSKGVLEHVEGIDLFIDGHDHRLVEEEVAGTLLVETGCYLRNIGVVEIDEGAPTNHSVAYGSFEGADVSVAAIIDKENERVEGELGLVLGQTPFYLDGERVPGVRTQETNLGDFCADAVRWTAEQETSQTIDAAVMGGGSIRASIEAGDITLKQIMEVFPFNNSVVVMKVTGVQLLEAFEAACQGVGTNDALGSFPQVSGITYAIDGTVPFQKGPNYPESTFASPAAIGSRVTISDVGGRDFEETATYTLATTDFFASGGDTYYAFKEASQEETPIMCCFDYEALASYLVEGCDHAVPDRYKEPQGRITITVE